MQLVPGAPVTERDVLDAARMVLGFEQRPSYVAWRTNRWHSDDALPREIARDRHDWEFRGYRWLLRDTVFSLPIAQDILIAGLPYTPQHAIQGLDQMGLRAHPTTYEGTDASTDEDLALGLGLLDRPVLWAPIRESGFPLTEVSVALKVVSEDRLALMVDAGMSAAEMLDLIFAGQIPDEATLRVMAALLNPSET